MYAAGAIWAIPINMHRRRNMPYSIETFDLSKHYGSLKAVDRLNLRIEEGEIFGLLGPNGAGKTTAISMLCTILEPTSGKATVNGFDVEKEPEKVRKSIGIVFQQPSTDDLLTGRENLKMHTLLFGVPKEAREERTAEALSLVGLEKRADDLVRTYSGGMRRRLEIARGVMHHPKILFLDEPTLGLDPQTRTHVWAYISALAKRENMTVLLTTHYMEEAEALCTRVGIIDAGKIITLGTPKELKTQLGGDRISIKTKNPGLEALKKLACIQSLNFESNTLALIVKEGGCNLKRILELSGDAEDVELKPVTLNDVFLHHTGKEIREAEAEGGYMERMAADR